MYEDRANRISSLVGLGYSKMQAESFIDSFSEDLLASIEGKETPLERRRMIEEHLASLKASVDEDAATEDE